MLTAKQRELLLFIDERLKSNGISPSFDEMRDALELKSKSGVHRLISALEERGFIRRLPNRARALEVLKVPVAAPVDPCSEGSWAIVLKILGCALFWICSSPITVVGVGAVNPLVVMRLPVTTISPSFP